MQTNRERRRARRLQAIKDRAIELIIDDGIDAFSIHRLADRLDLTVGALYRYFDSVDHLMSAVQVDILEHFDVYLDHVVQAQADRPPLERLVTLCHGYLALDVLEPERFRLIARFVSSPEPVLDEDAARASMELTRRLLGRLADIITAAQRGGSFSLGHAFDRAIIAWSSLQGLAERRKLARLDADLFNPERLTRELLRSLLLGWGAAAEEVDDALTAVPNHTFFELALKNS